MFSALILRIYRGASTVARLHRAKISFVKMNLGGFWLSFLETDKKTWKTVWTNQWIFMS